MTDPAPIERAITSFLADHLEVAQTLSAATFLANRSDALARRVAESLGSSGLPCRQDGAAMTDIVERLRTASVPPMYMTATIDEVRLHSIIAAQACRAGVDEIQRLRTLLRDVLDYRDCKGRFDFSRIRDLMECNDEAHGAWMRLEADIQAALGGAERAGQTTEGGA